jgi:hypothetical protein
VTDPPADVEVQRIAGRGDQRQSGCDTEQTVRLYEGPLALATTRSISQYARNERILPSSFTL